jgi:serralysin
MPFASTEGVPGAFEARTHPGALTEVFRVNCSRRTLDRTQSGPASKVAIVYSETSANRFFDKIAYSQLFMAAQNQAAMAGVPFDILTEADLTDVAKLAQYHPGLPLVPERAGGEGRRDHQGADDAVYDSGVGLITAGNFMTNDETGAALPDDSYSRMKILLGVAPQGFAGAANVTLVAADAALRTAPPACAAATG